VGNGGAGQMISIVVPCFNEADRLDVDEVVDAINRNAGWKFLFVNDGSTDQTQSVLRSLQAQCGQRVEVLTLDENRGKGEAVRLGMKRSLGGGAEIIAYADADTSTPFCEMERLIARLQEDGDVNAVLGSRVRLLGTDVKRKPWRHVVGRIYGTLASLVLMVPVYDTQCGAKVFRRTPALIDALSDPFQERWAFDVELLSRLARRGDAPAWARIVEEPLQTWHARPGSKLSLGSAFRAVLGLLRIGWRHRRGSAGGTSY
jgi:dolichyl-phosphate beta-glucosyltransferase